MQSDDLIAALMSQRVVRGDRTLARRLAEIGAKVQLSPGQVLLRQEEDGSAIYFLLRGSVRVLVNGRMVARRAAGETVGEMAAIDPRALRAATVIVQEPGVALRLSEPQMVALGERVPKLWRHLAAEMAERLRESNRAIRSPNPRPLFLLRGGDDVARSKLADALAGAGLQSRPWPAEAEPETWHALVSAGDFGVLLTTEAPPDREDLLWLGLCAGMLGRGRAFVVTEIGGGWSGCERLPWDRVGDPEMCSPAAVLAEAASDLGPR